jgi:hypothetical protein
MGGSRENPYNTEVFARHTSCSSSLRQEHIMLSKPLAFALLAAGCMTAAAGGAYVAMRHNPSSPALEAQNGTSELDGRGVAPDPEVSAPVATDGVATTLGTTAARSGASERQAITAPLVEPRASAPRRRQVARSPESRRTRSSARAESSAPPAPIETAPLPAVEDPAESLSFEPEAARGQQSPPLARFEEITVPSETVIGVQVDTAVTSERARVEDRVEGHVTRDVAVGGRVAIPAGTKLLGSVTLVERGGKFKERARIAVRFHTAQMPDGSRVALQTTAVMREGSSPSRETAAKVGGSAVGGAILGAILGGTKGAVLGGTAGAAGGTAVVAAGDRNAATLPAGTTVSIRLMSDVALTVER